MIFFKNYKEKVILLEYENKILQNKLNMIEKFLKESDLDYNPIPDPPMCRIIRGDVWDISYDTLRKKHRR